MKTFQVIVTVHERRDYLVQAPSKELAKEVYSDFEENCDVTIIEETVEEVEEIKWEN
jgi:hypothetical protein|tara:strand:- start:177 stop:347 length:171 start_codon:yes stop_codon:yes gene_type:complete